MEYGFHLVVNVGNSYSETQEQLFFSWQSLLALSSKTVKLVTNNTSKTADVFS